MSLTHYLIRCRGTFFTTLQCRSLFIRFINIFSIKKGLGLNIYCSIFLHHLFAYLIYLTLRNRREIRLNKIVIFLFSFLLIFAPVIFAFISQLLERSDTAFNYGNLFR